MNNNQYFQELKDDLYDIAEEQRLKDMEAQQLDVNKLKSALEMAKKHGHPKSIIEREIEKFERLEGL